MSCAEKAINRVHVQDNKNTKHRNFPFGPFGDETRSDHDCVFEVPTPAPITLGSGSLPMLKSIPIALPARTITKMVTLAIRKNGELISSF
jgi:hypothetical protein